MMMMQLMLKLAARSSWSTQWALIFAALIWSRHNFLAHIALTFTSITAMNLHFEYFHWFIYCSKYFALTETHFHSKLNILKTLMINLFRNTFFRRFSLFHHFTGSTLNTLSCFNLMDILTLHLNCSLRSSQWMHLLLKNFTMNF
jgi:hypothetical protein